MPHDSNTRLVLHAEQWVEPCYGPAATEPERGMVQPEKETESFDEEAELECLSHAVHAVRVGHTYIYRVV